MTALAKLRSIVDNEANWAAHIRAGLDPVSYEEISALVDIAEAAQAHTDGDDTAYQRLLAALNRLQETTTP